MDIIAQYFSTIRSFFILDPSGHMVDKVCKPIQKYLRFAKQCLHCVCTVWCTCCVPTCALLLVWCTCCVPTCALLLVWCTCCVPTCALLLVWCTCCVPTCALLLVWCTCCVPTCALLLVWCTCCVPTCALLLVWCACCVPTCALLLVSVSLRSTREDTVRCFVSSLVEDSGGELAEVCTYVHMKRMCNVVV